jgi:RNA polymerase sigma-70 factor (ECF subfamily)
MASTIEVAMSKEIPVPDRALLASVRAGDREAREVLARRVGNSAYVFALQLSGGSETARDIAQDSVLRFFQHLDRFDADRPLEPWLYQIVRNRVRDLHRRNRLRRHESLDAWLEHGKSDTADPAADPARDAERHELRQRVWQAMSELSEAHREIIVLRDYHDFSYREIADVLSIPQGTVMSRLHAARKSLRTIIVSTGESFPDQPPIRRGDR